MFKQKGKREQRENNMDIEPKPVKKVKRTEPAEDSKI